MCAVDICFNGPNGAFHDELDAHRCGQVNNHIGVIDEFGQQLAVFDAVQVVFQQGGGLEMADVLDAARREIVEQDDAITAVQEPFGKMRSDEAGTTSDQIAQ